MNPVPRLGCGRKLRPLEFKASEPVGCVIESIIRHIALIIQALIVQMSSTDGHSGPTQGHHSHTCSP